jgi:ketosteroid isomerase-like protein
VIDHGKSVVVWRRQKDGTLKIAVDTFNSDARSL